MGFYNVLSIFCGGEPYLLFFQEALPNWKDKFDILATLRACNYDPHEAINNYMARGGENDVMKAARNTTDAKLMEEKDARIKELEDRIRKLVRSENW